MPTTSPRTAVSSTVPGPGNTATGPWTEASTELSTELSTDARSTALRDVAPLAVAVIPFSMAIGATIAESDVSAPAALAGSVLIMAGAAQLAALQVLDAGAGLIVAVATALMINVRLVLYSAALSRWFDGETTRRRLLLAVPLIDQTFLLGQRRFTEETTTAWRRRYYLTASATMFTAFVTTQVLGYSIGAALPASLGLHLAAPLAFAGLLGAAPTSRASNVAIAAAAGAVIVASALPGGVAIPLAAVAGLTVGGIADRTTSGATSS